MATMKQQLFYLIFASILVLLFPSPTFAAATPRLHKELDEVARDRTSFSSAEIAEIRRALHKMESSLEGEEAMVDIRKFLRNNEAESSEMTEDSARSGDSRSRDHSAMEDALVEAMEDCIISFRVDANTGTKPSAGQDPSLGNNPLLKIEVTSGQEHSAELTGKKDQGSNIVLEIKTRDFTPAPSECLTRKDIKRVYLEARGSDGWFVTNINTSYITSSAQKYSVLTTDPCFDKWVDNDEAEEYFYNASSHLLTLKDETDDNCVTYFKISATTGDSSDAGFSSQNMNGKTHHFELQLKDQTLQADIKSPAHHNQQYTSEIDLNTFTQYQDECIEERDIGQVRLVAGGDDGWSIKQIETYIRIGSRPYQVLTSNPGFNKWLDGNGDYEYDATRLTLDFVTSSESEDATESRSSKDDKPDSSEEDKKTIKRDQPRCGYGVPVCQCDKEADVCVIYLEIDEMRTFTSYTKFPVQQGDGIFVRGAQGVIYNIEDDGVERPLEQYADRQCARDFSPQNCSDPQYVDGKTYRNVIGVNGQVPGPTIIVHEGQYLEIQVHNNMSSEGISIHWHGMYHRGTPWMDGVGQVSQCQISPSSTYTYIYRAYPAGTFWYHSHTGAQRTDGFFGALIVMENEKEKELVEETLWSHKVDRFEDHPDKHTLALMDWQNEASLDMFTRLNAGLGFHPGVPIGEVPPSRNESKYPGTRSYENAEVGPIPYFSGLINGKGRHKDVSYSKTRLSVFTVTKCNKYRFRLIGAQGLYAYKFSIDGHKLTVVGADDNWIEPVKNVDYIIIHTGERYDFILEADADIGNYWIRAETLEIDMDSNGRFPPYKSLGHVADAILQYTEGPIKDAPEIPSTEYAYIKSMSQPPDCLKNGCIAVNCPFKDFHPAYNTSCTNVNELKLLLPTPLEELPEAYPSDDEESLHFMNFNFEGDSETSSINGRNFKLPPVPPQTQNRAFQNQSNQCNLTTDCNPSTIDCFCTHIIDIPYNKTIQFVLSAVGVYHNAHPIHLHGHTFHVVHVGYPEYKKQTGFADPDNQNTDIQCNDGEGVNGRCTVPGWKGGQPPQDFKINEFTIRKDTVMVPAGGYVVINFISDNPGHWFMHCHIEAHQLEGMAMIINEAFDMQQEAPETLNQCGDYIETVEDYKWRVQQYETFIAPRSYKAAE